MIGGFIENVKVVMAVLALLPLAIVMGVFALRSLAKPNDPGNSELAGEAITEAVHHGLPWWVDPVGFIILALVAITIVGLGYFAMWAWKNQ